MSGTLGCMVFQRLWNVDIQHNAYRICTTGIQKDNNPKIKRAEKNLLKDSPPGDCRIVSFVQGYRHIVHLIAKYMEKGGFCKLTCNSSQSHSSSPFQILSFSMMGGGRVSAISTAKTCFGNTLEDLSFWSKKMNCAWWALNDRTV